MTQSQKDFLTKLQTEAKQQAKLNQSRILPQELDGLTSFVGRYPWQVLLVSSGLTSLALEILKGFLLR